MSFRWFSNPRGAWRLACACNSAFGHRGRFLGYFGVVPNVAAHRRERSL